MKVFISWSGDRSKSVGLALYDWIGLMFETVQPWISDKDIELGQHWLGEIMDILSEFNFGIVCLTPENVLRPWVLFEAGALGKTVGKGRVVPLVFGMKKTDVNLPLGAFQGEAADEAGLKALAHCINKVAPIPRPTETIDRLFNSTWPELKAKLDQIPITHHEDAAPATRTPTDLLEELVVTVRRLETRMADVSSRLPSGALHAARQYGDSIPRSWESNDLLRALAEGMVVDPYIAPSIARRLANYPDVAELLELLARTASPNALTLPGHTREIYLLLQDQAHKTLARSATNDLPGKEDAAFKSALHTRVSG